VLKNGKTAVKGGLFVLGNLVLKQAGIPGEQKSVAIISFKNHYSQLHFSEISIPTFIALSEKRIPVGQKVCKMVPD
jgi:hypothetical protein